MNRVNLITIGKREIIWIAIAVVVVVVTILAIVFRDGQEVISNQSGVAPIGNKQEQSEESTIDDRESAARWYKQSCSLCHGDDKEGRLDYPSLIHVKEKYTVDEIYLIITEGTREMHGGFLQGKEAEAVARWLKAE
ncbi:hypothetical protein BHU72_00465 [Desulfuribacillus stibiiarsenatis]|uniref:Cytochrome c domain-containing protein n=1 Tax=Desulfuribacillus stibiiarsenatis TaxID=1390249 RepID=A0A1E5L9G2_9FIRM|nr:cytochrome c [Desulfuribacillus stibiiarsenatis]OEH86780.1 hypothetical protein BHU72_00465 [Desulfuribacillus stibiiarsenatis]